MLTATELLERLEDAGERRDIEAKSGLGDCTEETVCAFANEPDLGPSMMEKETAERALDVSEASQERYGNAQKRYGNEQKRYGNEEERYGNVPASLVQDLAKLGKKSAVEEIRRLIAELCRLAPRTRRELANLLRRDPKYLTDKHLRPMVEAGTLTLTRPDEPRHPDQAYRAPTPPEEDDA